MPGRTNKYGEREARATERAYATPEITAQRVATLESLALKAGESVIDIGVGPGLLSADMAQQVGATGRVVGVDSSSSMVAIAARRCGEFSQVEIATGDAQKLEFPDGSFDAAVCTQVLLYVPDVGRALMEMHRVLKPGGRALVLETDWRGLVLSSSYPDVTETMIRSWDDAAASPQLPPVLDPMLREAGFTSVGFVPIPVYGTSCAEGNYVYNMIKSFSETAVKQRRANETEAGAWVDDLLKKSAEGTFFFCINRFLFCAYRC